MKIVSLLEIPYGENALDYFECVRSLSHPILFDSGRPNSQRGRYDIFSASPLFTLEYQQGILSHSQQGKKTLSGPALLTGLNQLLSHIRLPPSSLPHIALPFYGGLAGYLAYDLWRQWEAIPSLARRDIDIPDLLLGYYPWAGVLDHERQKAWLSFLPDCPELLRNEVIERLQQPPNKKTNKFNIINELKPQMNVESYSQKVAEIQEFILSGDCYQINLGQRFTTQYSGDPWLPYRSARRSMASPYGAYFAFRNSTQDEESAILCFSPERFIQLEEKRVLTQPIKGTIARHPDPSLDQQAAQSLLASEKNRAENLMIVDLLRNDLGKCCEFGSIKTERLFELQSASNVHHLVSSITGQLSKDKSAFDLLFSTFPGGSITGAPKIRAMEIIEALEPSRRSIYCGSLAYININGHMDSNIAIRTALCHHGELHCWGGGGIVADSAAEDEYQESLVKINSIIKELNLFKTVS